METAKKLLDLGGNLNAINKSNSTRLDGVRNVFRNANEAGPRDGVGPIVEAKRVYGEHLLAALLSVERECQWLTESPDPIEPGLIAARIRAAIDHSLSYAD